MEPTAGIVSPETGAGSAVVLFVAVVLVGVGMAPPPLMPERLWRFLCWAGALSAAVIGARSFTTDPPPGLYWVATDVLLVALLASLFLLEAERERRRIETPSQEINRRIRKDWRRVKGSRKVVDGIEHRAGCPANPQRTETFTQTRPDGIAVETTRCLDCAAAKYVHSDAPAAPAEASESARADTKKIAPDTIREDEQAKRKVIETISAARARADSTASEQPRSPGLALGRADDKLQRLLDEGVAILRDYSLFGIPGVSSPPQDAQAWAARVEYEVQGNPRALAEFRYRRKRPFAIDIATPFGGLSRDDLEQKIASLSKIIRDRNRP